jgi:hypothetical protein
MGYQIAFRSFKNTAYVLEINGGGTALDGAVDTFVTEEDADTDFFKPVRTQSGTFRYLGSGSGDRAVWLAMIPTDSLDIPVKLVHQQGQNYVTDWQGYIQPSVYHNDYPANGGLMEHKFSVQCPLSVLDTIDIDATVVNSYPVVTIGQLLHTYIFGKLTGTTINGYFIQGSSTVTRERLNIKVMWANFVEIDSSGNLKSKYTLRQVLEEVCKLFGWCCRMHGMNVYFTMPVDNSLGFTFYTGSQMTNGSTGTSSDRGTFNITDAMFCDTDDHEEVQPGIGKVTVRSDINELDNLVEIPYDELFDQYNIGQVDTIIRSVDWYEHNVYNLIRQPNANNSQISYEDDAVSLTCYMALVPGTGAGAGGAKKYCRFIAYDDGDVGEVGEGAPLSKEQYSWRKCIELFHSYDYSGSDAHDMFTIASKQVFVISDGVLYINFKCHQVSAWLSDTGSQYPKPQAQCKLRIGDKYWNGSAWVGNSSATFMLPFTSEGAKTNRQSINDPQYKGYGIPVTDTMRGVLEFAIQDVATFSTVTPEFPPERADINGFLPLLDFEIGFVRGVIEEKKHRGNEFVSTGGAFREEYNVDLIFASDMVYGQANYQRHMPAGLGYILNSSTEKPLDKILPMVGSTTVIPEQELARLIAKYGEVTHRMVVMNVWTDLVGEVKPNKMSTGLESGMFPLAIDHNWRDDVTTLTLIKVNPTD